MILYKLLFLHLPYRDTEDFPALHSEILAYQGCDILKTKPLRDADPDVSFIPTSELVRSCERRHIPRDLLLLLSRLVNLKPESRPTAEKVKMGLRGVVHHAFSNRGMMPDRVLSQDKKDASASNGGQGVLTAFTTPLNRVTNILRRTPSAPSERSEVSL